MSSLEKKPSILLVDDDGEIRTYIRTALEQAGFEISEAPNGKDAMNVFRRAPCEAVLTDILMPEGEGIRLILDLKRESPATAIIVMTGGSGTTDYSFIAKGFGVRYVLFKPFSVEKLVMTVRAALAGKN